MIVYKNIKNLLISKPAVFSVFLVSLTCSMCCILFVFNFVSNLYHDYSKYTESERTYLFCADKHQFDSSYPLFANLHPNQLQHVYAVIENEDGTFTTADIHGSFASEIKVDYGKYFSEEDILNGARVAVLPNDYYREDPESARPLTIGNRFSYLGQNYEVIGIGMEACLQIPYTSLPENAPISYYAVVAANYLHNRQLDQFCQSIATTFHVDEIQLPINESSFFSSMYALDFLIVILALVFGIANFNILYQYILETRKNQIRVFRLLGCSSPRLIFYYVAELFFFLSASYLLAVTLFKVLTTHPIFDFYLLTGNLSSTLYSYAYAACLILYGVFFTPTLFKWLHQ